MCDLVVKPEDGFSRNAFHLNLVMRKPTLSLCKNKVQISMHISSQITSLARELSTDNLFKASSANSNAPVSNQGLPYLTFGLHLLDTLLKL